jgi:hypothetical protein
VKSLGRVLGVLTHEGHLAGLTTERAIVGYLLYNSSSRTELDDRALAHLQIAMIGKLRRKESFAFSWKNSAADGDGRRTIWIAPEIPLEFVFHGGRAPTINKAWVEALMLTTHTAAGLHLIPEPPDPAQDAVAR